MRRSTDGIDETTAIELRREGVVVRRFADVFSGPGEVFNELQASVHRRWAEVKAAGYGADGRKIVSADPAERKEYRVYLLSQKLALDDLCMRLALDTRLLGLVSRYLGMRAYLREVMVWWDRPTASPAKETQLWHRDYDDLINLKVFVYLNDVALDAGPFSFLAGTHPFGSHRALIPEADPNRRMTDEEIGRFIPATDARVCLGAAGTVVICDTCGYHRGVKPTLNDRLMLALQYTSGAASVPRTFELAGRQSRAPASPQWWALHP